MLPYIKKSKLSVSFFSKFQTLCSFKHLKSTTRLLASNEFGGQRASLFGDTIHSFFGWACNPRTN
jgi:ATP-dependent helicase/DNAse subunit B